MASLEDAISSGDPNVIKKKRISIQGMMTKLQKSLGNLLIKSGSKFEHDKIKRLQVQQKHAKLKRLEESFDEIHQAYLDCRDEAEDSIEESSQLEKEDQHCEEVIDKMYEVLQLYADYEESYSIYKAAHRDPNLAKKEAEDKSTKEALAKKLKDEKVLQKQEAEAASKAEEKRIKKDLRANVVKKEKLYNEAIGKYRTAKKYAEDLTKFARGFTKEQVVSQVMEYVHVRSLPTFEAMNMLVERLKAASNAAEAFADAIEEDSGIDDVKGKVTFDEVAEDSSVQKIVSILNLILNAKGEYNRKASGSSLQTAAGPTPIKVKLNTPKFSGKSRDFAIFKKEFMDVIVTGRSNPQSVVSVRAGITVQSCVTRTSQSPSYTRCSP